MTAENDRETESAQTGKGLPGHRALLVAWSAGFVVVLVVLSVALASLFLRHQAVFAVRLSTSPPTSCWDVFIQSDGRAFSPPGGSSEWSQCGGSPARVVEVGTCRYTIRVEGEAESYDPVPVTQLSVEFLRNSEVSETIVWNNSGSRIHTHLFSCGG